MADIIPFESSAVPAYLKNAAKANNEDLLAYATTSFPVMSIKGKVFTLVRGEDRQVVPNPRDPESPATNITVAMIKVSPNKSKTYYANGFAEGSDDYKPTCFSNDGIKPDSSVAHPQCKTCAACKWNAFGTARGENGQVGRGKACSDFIRVAIADMTNIEEPILLRVPPASIKAVGEFGKWCARKNVPYQALAVRIGFDVEQATPRLTFKAMGFLEEAVYHQVVEIAKSDTVDSMINGMAHESAAEHTEAEDDELPTQVVKAEASMPTAKPVQKAEPKATPKAVEEPSTPAQQTADDIIARAMGTPKVVNNEEDLGDVLDDLGFD